MDGAKAQQNDSQVWQKNMVEERGTGELKGRGNKKVGQPCRKWANCLQLGLGVVGWVSSEQCSPNQWTHRVQQQQCERRGSVTNLRPPHHFMHFDFQGILCCLTLGLWKLLPAHNLPATPCYSMIFFYFFFYCDRVFYVKSKGSDEGQEKTERWPVIDLLDKNIRSVVYRTLYFIYKMYFIL